jgi:hypothetical protein
MKIEKQVDTAFKPVTISITFESQEEIDTMTSIMGYSISIPSFLEKEFPKTMTSKKLKFFADFMSYFHRMLK